MKIVVTGDREWTSLETIHTAIQYVLDRFDLLPKELRLVEGECRGADKGCRIVAEALGVEVIPEPPEWKKFGKAAGVIRNQRMLDDHPDLKVCLAFHDDLSRSKGTKDMIKRCQKLSLPVWHFQTNSTSPKVL